MKVMVMCRRGKGGLRNTVKFFPEVADKTNLVTENLAVHFSWLKVDVMHITNGGVSFVSEDYLHHFPNLITSDLPM